MFTVFVGVFSGIWGMGGFGAAGEETLGGNVKGGAAGLAGIGAGTLGFTGRAGFMGRMEISCLGAADGAVVICWFCGFIRGGSGGRRRSGGGVIFKGA